jgi:hypothetical protein
MSENIAEITACATLRGRGLALMSGGLDSTLSVCVLRAQGLHMEGVVFESPFFGSVRARKAAAMLGITLHVVDFTDDIVELLKNPPHGFGSAMNPCIDCHTRMLQRAGAMMEKMGFDFLSTGEVLNQRPMSQTRRALGLVANDAGFVGRIVRPLSALRLDPTEPEKCGIIDRSRLLGLNGRSRHEQMKMAPHYGIREYPTPAGGCLLTEPRFCAKVQDLMTHEGLDQKRLLWLLPLGRQMRLPGGAKCIIGRNRADNEALGRAATPPDVLVQTVIVPGPTLLLPGGASAEDVARACGICAGYADPSADSSQTLVEVICGSVRTEHATTPLARDESDKWILSSACSGVTACAED